MLETSSRVETHGETLEQGYKTCRKHVKRDLKHWDWLISNIGGDNKKGVYALLNQFLQTNEMLDLECTNGQVPPISEEIHQDLSNAFSGDFASPELAALVDTCNRYNVDPQCFYDPMQAANNWVNKREFSTFKQLDEFCESFGGSIVTSLAPVIGVIKPDYKQAAAACGKAVMLTQVLANCVDDIKRNRNFIAKQDIAECEVDISRLKMRRPTEEFKHLVRLYTSRLEPMYHEAGKLVSTLDFDGKRTLTSLLAACWKIVSKMKVDPNCILSADGVLTKADKFGLRSKHLLGMDTKLPFIPGDHGHH